MCALEKELSPEARMTAAGVNVGGDVVAGEEPGGKVAQTRRQTTDGGGHDGE